MRTLYIIGAIFLLISQVSLKNKEEWKTRAIYQIITDRFATSDSSEPNCNLSQYCGGTFQGIINKLDYIKGMGFDAIWISPVVENTEGSSCERIEHIISISLNDWLSPYLFFFSYLICSC